MFAARLCYPTMVFLSPLLRHTHTLQEFLALRLVQANLTDLGQPSTVDHATFAWYRTLEGHTEQLFGQRHGRALERIRWQVHNLMHWLPGWMAYIGSLCWDEWMSLDLDLQRLYLLLDYEHPGAWYPKILCNSKYSVWIAKVVTFCLEQWNGLGGALSSSADEEQEQEEDGGAADAAPPEPVVVGQAEAGADDDAKEEKRGEEEDVCDTRQKRQKETKPTRVVVNCTRASTPQAAARRRRNDGERHGGGGV